MSQDNKKSFVMYQGDGSNNVFSVPMTKGKYGTISVAFVRRGLDQYEYNPDTWGLNGGLFAWDLSGTKVYTDTATPAIGATVYDQYGVGTGDTVTAVGGATITVNTNVYTRDTLHDVDENTVLTWTGDTLQVGDYIVIERTTTRTQPFEFQNNQKHIEKSDDNLERQIQEVADKVDNALLVDPTHTIDSNKMNPVEWMKTILRSVDKSVRGFRYLNGWLDYSLDDPNIADADKTWNHLLNTENIKSIREQAYIVNGVIYYRTQYKASDGTWKTLADPRKWNNMKLSDLADTDFTNLSAGNFIMFDGLKWKNVYSSATASWGTLIGDITSQTDLMNKFSNYVRKDGTSIMTGVLKMRATSSFQCAIAPYWDGVGFFKLNDNNSVTLMASIENQDSFAPAENNVYNIGSTSKKWKNLYLAGKAYMSVINNGYDIAVPVTNSADTLALKSEVDLAANSGDQLTEKGVWYAKMYSATVAPSAEDGTNYADFSQTDNQGNPIIVIYKRQNGAWVQDQTITPPAEYNGYVPVTSKIWDIVEQSGQQGGKVLWSHNQKTFTPSPLIILFEDIEITGNSTVVMPQNPSANQIVNKEYVDNKTSQQGYHPDLFDWKWADHQLDDMQWLRADTFSWQSGAVYEAAFNELFNDIYKYTTWYLEGEYLLRTYSPTPSVGDQAYLNSEPNPVPVGLVQAYDSVNNTITVNNKTYAYNSNQYVTPVTETVAGITVTYYPGTSGRKIVAYADMSAVESVYAATGVAWYYIIDNINQRFKLPRSKHNKYADTLGVAGNGKSLGLTDGSQEVGLSQSSYSFRHMSASTNGVNVAVGTSVNDDPFSQSGKAVGIIEDGTKSGIIAQQEQDTDQYKYLYFYAGPFTQTALENTAGLNAELFNGKADLDLSNVLANIDFVVARQEPTASNNYTWYRKYKSGWVEQGGLLNQDNSAGGTVILPVTMASNYYNIHIQTAFSGNQSVIYNNRTTTGFNYSGNVGKDSWLVCGMSAS